MADRAGASGLVVVARPGAGGGVLHRALCAAGVLVVPVLVAFVAASAALASRTGRLAVEHGDRDEQEGESDESHDYLQSWIEMDGTGNLGGGRAHPQATRGHLSHSRQRKRCYSVPSTEGVR